jgi:putative peptidoglycan lipid II flippase
MVKGIIAAMTREIRGLHEAAYLLALFTFLSQVLALIRDRAFAHFFGAGPTLDAYFAAFRIPDAVFAILTLFVSAYALVPMFHERNGPTSDASRRLLGSVLTVFGIASIGIAGFLFVTAPTVVMFLFPGFGADTLAHVVLLSRIMLLQPILLGLSSVVASVVQATRQFFLYALAPIFYNLGILVGVFFLYPTFGITGLAWGVVLGALLHLLVQTVPLCMNGFPLPRVSLAGFRETLKVVAVSFPRAAALSANQLLLLAFAGAASLAAAGSVSVVSFAYNLQSVPLSVIGVSYASALFPSLALLIARGEHDAFMREVWAAVRHVAFWLMPSATFVIVLRAEIVRVILGSGSFSWADTRLTAAVLAAFAVSLVAQAVILIFSRAYYAAGRSLVPVVVNVAAAGLTAVSIFGAVAWFQGADASRYFLDGLFRIGDLPGTEVITIALLYSFIYVIAALVFAILYARHFGYDPRTTRTLSTSFAASVIGAAAAYGALQIIAPFLPTDTFVGIALEGLAGAVGGGAVWAATLWLLKSTELSEITALVRARFKG